MPVLESFDCEEMWSYRRTFWVSTPQQEKCKVLLLSTIVAEMQYAIMNCHGLQKNVQLDRNGRTQPYTH
jgi:hypothetical protein